MVLMHERRRLYTAMLADHPRRHRQMALVSGPRQVGKTTTCRSISASHPNWDTMNLGFQGADCLRVPRPVVVLARTFLSQLLWSTCISRSGVMSQLLSYGFFLFATS